MLSFKPIINNQLGVSRFRAVKNDLGRLGEGKLQKWGAPGPHLRRWAAVSTRGNGEQGGRAASRSWNPGGPPWARSLARVPVSRLVELGDDGAVTLLGSPCPPAQPPAAHHAGTAAAALPGEKCALRTRPERREQSSGPPAGRARPRGPSRGPGGFPRGLVPTTRVPARAPHLACAWSADLGRSSSARPRPSPFGALQTDFFFFNVSVVCGGLAFDR